MSGETENRSATDPGSRFAVDAALLARLAITLVFLVTTLLLTTPFLAGLVGALVMAVLFVNSHRRIEAWLSPSIAASVSVVIVALIVVAPLWLVANRLIGEAVVGAAYIQEEITKANWRNYVDAHPWLRTVNTWIEAQIDLREVLRRAASFLTNSAASIIRQSTGQIFAIVLAFYLLFFFLRDRVDAIALAHRLSPFSQRETEALLLRVRDTIRAIMYGTLAVAALQGALGGLMFWWLGFPSPAFWALVMGMLSIVPVLGTFVVWVPATIYLAMSDRWADAALLAFWGAGVIGTVDNLVRPLLIGESLRLHTAPTLVAILGGLQLFGASGLVLGPVAMTTTAMMLAFWRDRASGDPQAR